MKKWSVLPVLVMLVLPLATALADTVLNDVSKSTTNPPDVTAGGWIPVEYWIVTTGNDKICNASVDAPTTLMINVPADTDIAASPDSPSFTDCGQDNAEEVQFHASTPGIYSIPAVTATGGSGGYNTTSDLCISKVAVIAQAAGGERTSAAVPIGFAHCPANG
jgi:hypothetical protein